MQKFHLKRISNSTTLPLVAALVCHRSKHVRRNSVQPLYWSLYVYEERHKILYPMLITVVYLYWFELPHTNIMSIDNAIDIHNHGNIHIRTFTN